MPMLNKVKSLKDTVTSKAKRLSGGGRFVVGLDIGTEYVKALVARISGNEIEIIGAGRAHQGLSDMQAGAIADIGAVVANCDEALNEAEQQAGISVRPTVIGIAGELVKGTTLSVKCRRRNPDKELDLDEIQRIVSLIQKRAEQRARQQLSWEMGGKDVEIRLVNSALVSIEIDGYPVTSPVGFKGKEVSVQLYTAFAPMIHIGALERTAQELDVDLLAVAAEPFAVARSVIGSSTDSAMSAILMDVGGGTTDIAVLNDGGVQGTKMFGIGGRAYTKAIQKALDVTFTQAEELKVGLTDNKVPASKLPAVEAALKKTLEVWTSGVELALGEFNNLDHLPHHLLLCGGGSSLEMLTEKLGDTNWYTDLPFTRKPTIQLIQPSQVVGMTDKTGKVNDHTYITAMGLLRVGVDTLAQSTDQASTGSLRQKIDKMLRV
jgi:cell division protein FtsA